MQEERIGSLIAAANSHLRKARPFGLKHLGLRLFA